jgi:hypothetical protein
MFAKHSVPNTVHRPGFATGNNQIVNRIDAFRKYNKNCDIYYVEDYSHISYLYFPKF